uniref:Superoxide dismutase n=1 Tax=Globisporangium ultimum (strain ATCC 200006 / CBS 805.95 / DAOM BR144) TaxID=431595 RepID=K3W5B7_GLOUD
MSFVLPVLPYEYDALAPFADELTMKLHHMQHHRTYVEMANKLIETEQNGELKGKDIVEVVQKAKADGIRNNAGGHYNHSLFWTMMAPPGSANTGPYGALKEKIDEDFGSLDNMKRQFNDVAATRFGSGWAWLGVGAQGKLGITSTPNQDSPLMPMVDHPMIPILGLDVWEHAYFLSYRSRRPQYIHGFWNVVNWDQVVHYYDNFASKQKPVPLEMEDVPTTRSHAP